jgi:putative transposase
MPAPVAHRDLVDRGPKPGIAAQESAELTAARGRICDLEEEVKILRKAAAAVEAVVRPKDRYRLVAELRAEGVRIGRACHALGVSRSGYYAWAGRAPSPRAIRQAWLTDLIGTIHAEPMALPGCTPSWSMGMASRSGTTPSAC